MDQVGKRPGQRIGLRIASDDPAEAGADIDYPRRFSHFQQHHTALHIFQQSGEGDGIDRPQILSLQFLILAAAFQTELVLAGFLGFIKRKVRRLVQPVKFLALSCIMDANTGCHIDDLVIAKREMHFFTNQCGFGPDQFFRNLSTQKRSKFISAQTPNNIACMEQAREDPAHLPDRLISRPVAQCVVDLLEVVQINDEQRTGLFSCHRLQMFPDGLFQSRPVQKPGKRISGRAPPQVFQK